jgi:hypothetical protein
MPSEGFIGTNAANFSARRDARFHVSGPVLWNHEITARALPSKLLNRADGGKLHANRRRP